MEKSIPKVSPAIEFNLSKARGFGNILLVIFLFIWVAALSGVNLFLRWSVEQTMFETEVGISDGRWLVQLGYILVVFIPILILYFIIKIPRFKLMLRLWLIGGLFALLSVPAKVFYLTAQNQSYMLLTLALLVMIAFLLLLRKVKKEDRSTLAKSRLTGAAVLAGVALATPWVLWGALGSILDIVVVLIFGVVFAIFIIYTLFPFYFDETQPVGSLVDRKDYLFDGFVIAVFLMIITTGLSQDGSELMLTLMIPPAGWLIAGFVAAGRNRRDHGKLAVAVISALLLILPLAFFDMDELALVISGNTTGEVMYWAQRAGGYSIVFLLIMSIVFLIFFHLMEKVNTDKRINLVMVLLSILEFFTLYFFAGQPGFYGDRLFVIMKDQVDVSQLQANIPLAEKKQLLYTQLTSLADNSQKELRQKLDRLRIAYTPYYLVNGLEVNAGWFAKRMLTNSPGVDRVLDSPHLRPLPQVLEPAKGDITVPQNGSLWNLEMINVPKVHNELGVTGKGIVIGQTDSGVDGTHPELANNYRGKGISNDYNWLDPWYGSVSPVDIGGHGTGTTGIIVGATRGIAPGSEWIGCVNLARNLGNPALYLDCMQFMFAPYPQGGDPFKHGDVTKGAMIINNSWGCPRVEGCDPGVFDEAVSVLKAAGIFMSVAAGNNGYYGCSTITDPPSIYADVFATGAVDIRGDLSVFSSLGPIEVDGSGRQKPDLAAPGEQVLVDSPGGTYSFSSGTSFAAPHISGVVALMWSANPALVGDIQTTTRILEETAKHYTGRDPGCGNVSDGVGAGIVDAYAAVQASIALK